MFSSQDLRAKAVEDGEQPLLMKKVREEAGMAPAGEEVWCPGISPGTFHCQASVSSGFQSGLSNRCSHHAKGARWAGGISVMSNPG